MHGSVARMEEADFFWVMLANRILVDLTYHY